MIDEIKQDVEKVAADIRAADGQVDAATQRALGAVNRQTSWVKRHPKISLGIGLALVALIVAFIVRAV